MLKGFRRDVENLKYKNGLGIPGVSQQGMFTYLEKELALDKGHRVI